MIRTPSATRRAPCLTTANWRPLIVEIALIAFVAAAIVFAAVVGMSAARAGDTIVFELSGCPECPGSAMPGASVATL